MINFFMFVLLCLGSGSCRLHTEFSALLKVWFSTVETLSVPARFSVRSDVRD
jgi:hypothetical protein